MTLDDAIARIERIPVSMGEQSEVSFGLGDDVIERLESLFNQLVRTVSHYAWTETQFATTAVSYNGGMSSAWANQVDEQQIDQHVASLDQTLRFRAKLFRVLIASAQAAMAISIAAAAPASALIALNSAWRLAGELQGVLDLTPRQ